jgi:CheY-like chemotaxis protein
VVHGIATGLGGGVGLESAPGAGTRVTVWLPRLADQPPAAPTPTPVPPAVRRRVLLVDDDPPVARAIARMLERSGYEVATAPDAETALERFRADPAAFDLVFTDQTLPGMRGDELTVALLALRPDLPVLICTGYSERLDDESARALGARGLLGKPLDVRELARAVKDALGGGVTAPGAPARAAGPAGVVAAVGARSRGGRPQGRPDRAVHAVASRASSFPSSSRTIEWTQASPVRARRERTAPPWRPSAR